LLGVDRSHGAVWQWIHRLADSLADPPTASRRGSLSMSWLSDSTVSSTGSTPPSTPKQNSCWALELFEQRGTDAATAFLRTLDRKHDFSDTVFLVDGYGYLTALARPRFERSA